MLAGLAMPAVVAREGAAQASSVKFGTAAPGGAFIIYAGAFVDAIKMVSPSLAVRPVPTQGSLENVPLLEEGQLDIGLVFGELAQELFNPQDGPPSKLKVICTVYSSPGMFVVRADTRYRTIGDLKGRPIVWNGRGTALALQGRYVMEALDLDPEKDFEAIYTEHITEGPAMILEGRASALWGAGNRWPGFVKVASDPRGARFITPDSDEIERIVTRNRFMRRISIPPRRYPGQSEGLTTVGSWSYVLARPNLDDAIAYGLAAALHKAQRNNSLFDSQLADSTPQNTLAALPRQDALHKGVERYFREIGVLK
ncbi:TAXI family TRAP transporter solute-binding subunit [soil metagenome]